MAASLTNNSSSNSRPRDRIDAPDNNSVEELLREAVPRLKKLLFTFKKSNGHPEVTFQVQEWLAYLDKFLTWLETKAPARMTPKARDESGGIQGVLEALFNPAFHFPTDIASRAKKVFDRLEEDSWGGTNGGNEVSIATGSTTVTRRSPPVDHPIWGRNGIMHGFILEEITTEGRTKKRRVFNPEYIHEKRDFRKFGHNGLEPGAWWPFQACALFHGAHGASVAGISGQPEQGAYSIVISGQYEGMDHDGGEVLWYSSDGSKDNTDPENITAISSMTQSLRKSLTSGRPVRVLRSSKGNKVWSPAEGIRYDGLYQVRDIRTPRNKQHGLYEVFKLRRLPNQPSLESLRSIPTLQQLRDFERIKDYY